MSYCDLCNGLTIKKLFPPNIYCHAKNIAALQESSQTCSLCMILCRCVAAGGKPWPEWSERNPSPDLEFRNPAFPDDGIVPSLVGASADQLACDKTTCGNEEEDSGGDTIHNSTYHHDKHRACPIGSSEEDVHGGDDNYGIKLQIVEEVERSSSSIDLNGFTHIGISTKSGQMLSSLTLLVQEDDELGSRAITIGGLDKYISGRVLTSHYPSKAYFDVARTWLEECASTHSSCGDNPSSDIKLPDRVIDVALLGGNPRLTKGDSLKARYATLSHCWGKTLPMRTLTANIEQRMIGFALSDLPKTFREAVVVCRMLNIPYLWIDSICIIQDSLDDWEIQSSKMHSIFHNSALTLAALDAEDSSQGLFLPKRAYTDILPLPQTFGDSRGQAYIGPPTFDRYTHALMPVFGIEEFFWQQMHTMASQSHYVKSGLLHTRGWVLQEILLSRCVLYFFKGEMMWRCSQALWHQNGCRRSPRVLHHLRAAFKSYGAIFERVRREVWPFSSSRKRKRTFSDERSTDTGTEDRYHKKGARNAGQSSQQKGDNVTDTDRTRVSTPEPTGDEPAGTGGDMCIVDPGVKWIQDAFSKRAEYTINQHVFTRALARLEGYEGQNIEEVWFRVVDDYSSCQMTFAADKLLGLSGIASRFHDITQDDYIAGHWGFSLAQSLFWDSKPGSSRAASYRAPSWSWASMDGPVSTRGVFADKPIDPKHFRVLDASVRIIGKNPYGRVASAELLVHVSTMKAGWISTKVERPAFTSVIIDYDGNHVKHVGQWKHDDDPSGVTAVSMATADNTENEVKPEEQALCLGLCLGASRAPKTHLLVRGPEAGSESEPESDRSKIVVLVLRRVVGDEDKYERVGIGSVVHWDENVEIFRTLKIV